MKLLSRTDRKLEKLGFKKIRESKYGVTYERYNEEYSYTQAIEIYEKASGEHMIISYQSGVNANGYNNAVGLTYRETKLVMKKYRELKRRYWRTKDAVIS